jgi:hypothetical protein
MANPFDQFDAPAKPTGANPFDQFDAPPVARKPVAETQELSFGEKLVQSLPKVAQDWLSNPSVAGVNLGKGSAIHGAAMGAADPVVGAAQLATLGQSSTINQAIDQKSADYEAARQGQGRDGFDVARLVGNIISPANLAVGAAVPVKAVTTGGRALQGARAGAVGAALAPVVGADESFTAEKLMQAGAGAVGGGVLTPVVGKVADKITNRFARATQNPEIAGARASLAADEAVKKVLAETGVSPDSLPPGYLDEIRQQALASLKQGKELDASALLRLKDFDALGIKPTQGQITRDPTQFATERNLRAVPNQGAPLLNRFDEQLRQLQSLVRGYGDDRASDAYGAGSQLVGSLKNTDESLRAGVSGLYKSARESAGKDLDVPLQGLAQDYAKVLQNFGDKVPSGVRNNLDALGLNPMSPSNQKKVFTIEAADDLLKVINDNVGNDPATNAALTQLRGAVKNAVLAADSTGGPFAPAVAAAAKRFKLHEAVPALEAASQGGANADQFVNRYVVNGQTDQVIGLAKLLKQTDPEAFEQARAQLGSRLMRAAFGENLAGDKALAPERFAKALRDIGRSKLSAFFSPGEVEKIGQIARVGAYIGSTPTAAPVLGNPNMVWAGRAVNALERLPVVGTWGVPIARSAANVVKNDAAVRSAVNASVPSKSVNSLTPKQLEFLARALGSGAAGTAGFTGTSVGN